MLDAGLIDALLQVTSTSTHVRLGQVACLLRLKARPRLRLTSRTARMGPAVSRTHALSQVTASVFVLLTV